MDTFKNNELTPETEEGSEATMETAESSAHHREGAGSCEETCVNTSYNAYHTPQEGDDQYFYYQGRNQQMPQPEKKQKKAGKVFKRILATVLAIVVIAGSCTVSSFLTARYINNQHDTFMQQYVDQKVQAALDALQNATTGGSTNVIVTVDGLSASEIYAKNIQSVVAVNCTISGGAGQSATQSSAGTGFIISKDGFIVTNYHVVEGATSVAVILSNGKKYNCQIRGYDATNDVAVLKAEATNLKPVTIGSSRETKVGDPVVAIGNALGTLSFSLTVGNISGVNREITTDGSILNMLQTDAAINSGNSGGPLFNAKGEVIGITTAKYSGTTSSGASIEGISFAIPMDDVAGIISDLKEFGYVTGAYLGVTVSDVNSSAQAYGVPAGAYIHEVVEGCCANRAGIQPGDIIVELGGYKITSLNALTKALRNFKGGDVSTVVVWREGQRITLRITFDEKPQP